jgi:hypothetical protein
LAGEIERRAAACGMLAVRTWPAVRRDGGAGGMSRAEVDGARGSEDDERTA